MTPTRPVISIMYRIVPGRTIRNMSSPPRSDLAGRTPPSSFADRLLIGPDRRHLPEADGAVIAGDVTPLVARDAAAARDERLAIGRDVHAVDPTAVVVEAPQLPARLDVPQPGDAV